MAEQPLLIAQPSNLTDVLRTADVLGDACVRDVTVESARTLIMSRVLRLRLAYDGAAPDAPSSVIVKVAHPDRIRPAWINGRNEVAFYRDVAPALPAGLVPRCYAAEWNAATGDWHLLLEDLTDTHGTCPAWPLPPGEDACARIVAARARFHAAWWGDARLGTSVGQFLHGSNLDAFLHSLADRVARFIDRFGDHLPRERHVLCLQFLQAAPRIYRDLAAGGRTTIVQGDAHVWNCFLPHDGGNDVRLFDWDAWRVDKGATDIAHMMTVHWYPDRRQRLEARLLDRYHDTLLAHGVGGYTREALQQDYREATLRQIMWPLWQALNDIPPVIWWNNLERVLLAVDDLDCRALLG